MAKGSAYVVIRVDFEGDYYRPSEWIDVTEDWIYAGLEDRDNVIGSEVVASWVEE